MKNNLFKYIFLVFVVVLVCFSIYTIYKDEYKNNINNKTNENIVKETKISTDFKLSIVGFDTINPILSKNKNVQDISRLIFESLLTMNKEYKIEKCLAKEWSKIGDKSYVIKLRDDVKWQDNNLFNAKDVEFTIQKLKENNSSIYYENVKHISEVEVIDDYTIKLNLDMPIQSFEYNLIFPILSKNYYLNQDFLSGDMNNTPVATGMYKITSNDGKKITLKRNQNWWGLKEKQPKIENINITLYNSMGEVYSDFKLGNVDLFNTQTSNLEDYIGTLGYNKQEIKGREYDFLAINCEDNILSRTEIRKAISFCIDKNNIISNIFNGKYYIADFPLDFGTWVYNSENSSLGYNLEQAKQILIDNGWEYKYNNWQKIENYKTIRLNLNLIVDSDNEKRVQVAENIKNSLETIGIHVKILNVSNNQYNSYIENKNYQLLLGGSNVSIGSDLSKYFGINNLANYNNEEVISIINELYNISDEKLIKDKYKKISEIYKSDVPYVSLYFNRNTVVYSNKLMGEVSPNNYNIFYNIDKWYKEY